MTTYELEVTAEKMMADAGARPAFKGYSTPAAGTKFPFVLCTSVNEEIVHGMPSQKRVLKNGRYRFDRYGRAVERILRRFGGDGAESGEISEETRRLMEVTRESLELAIDKARPGNRLFDICGTVERHVTANGFTVVREFVGHGIGTQMHEEPQIPNYVDRRERESALERGHGSGDRADGERRASQAAGSQPDKWTAVTEDGKILGAFRAHGGDDGEWSVGADRP